jgi:hypothetical protein
VGGVHRHGRPCSWLLRLPGGSRLAVCAGARPTSRASQDDVPEASERDRPGVSTRAWHPGKYRPTIRCRRRRLHARVASRDQPQRSSRDQPASPRAWGDHRLVMIHHRAIPITPTRAGRPFRVNFFSAKLPHHPHAREDAGHQFRFILCVTKSPPRAWGDRLPWPQTVAATSITLTRVGIPQACCPWR